MIDIREVDPADTAVRELIGELDDYLKSLYPSESNHLDPVEELRKEHVHFLAAFRAGEVVGCGAVKLMPGGYGEIKRMYIRPSARGLGIAKKILTELEAFLIEARVQWARLETGIRQHEAIRLYESAGYSRSQPFGSYRPDPLSIFMEKPMGPPG
jgi:putative acetyltransferase